MGGGSRDGARPVRNGSRDHQGRAPARRRAAHARPGIRMRANRPRGPHHRSEQHEQELAGPQPEDPRRIEGHAPAFGHSRRVREQPARQGPRETRPGLRDAQRKVPDAHLGADARLRRVRPRTRHPRFRRGVLGSARRRGECVPRGRGVPRHPAPGVRRLQRGIHPFRRHLGRAVQPHPHGQGRQGHLQPLRCGHLGRQHRRYGHAVRRALPQVAQACSQPLQQHVQDQRRQVDAHLHAPVRQVLQHDDGDHRQRRPQGSARHLQPALAQGIRQAARGHRLARGVVRHQDVRGMGRDPARARGAPPEVLPLHRHHQGRRGLRQRFPALG